MRLQRTVRVGAGASIAAALGLTASAQAATFEVDNLGDPAGAGACTAADGDCSLTQAVANATSNAGSDDVVFKSGLTGTIVLNDQIPVTPAVITDRVTITGPGAEALTVQAPADNRIFQDYAALTLQGMTLTGGTRSEGGAIRVAGPGSDLTLNGVAITSSHAKYGGAVEAFAGPGPSATVSITGSTISGNVADQKSFVSPTGRTGGGLYISDNVNAQISNSTIANNTAAYGGGIFVGGDAPSSLVIRDSTISGNSVAGFDFDGANPRPATGGFGGGIDVGAKGALRLYNTIVANNTASPAPGAPTAPDLSGAAISGASLIESPLGSAVTTPAGFRTLTGVDPKLGPLQDNGGSTQTMKPGRKSVVVDAGGPSSSVDQRGSKRPVNIKSIKNAKTTGANGADMGAVELTKCEAQKPKKKHGKKAKCKKKHHKKHKK
jgi:parallel beta helix pectate lyase-like protein